jgi:hypothetical protein
MPRTYTTSKGTVLPMPEYGTTGWQLYQYEMRKIANKGHNFPYWNEEKHGRMLEDGYLLYKFTEFNQPVDYTKSEAQAKEVREQLKKTGHKATIICGYHKTIQREKFYTILYKRK